MGVFFLLLFIIVLTYETNDKSMREIKAKILLIKMYVIMKSVVIGTTKDIDMHRKSNNDTAFQSVSFSFMFPER